MEQNPEALHRLLSLAHCAATFSDGSFTPFGKNMTPGVNVEK
jgi:hypothetical protein